MIRFIMAIVGPAPLILVPVAIVLAFLFLLLFSFWTDRSLEFLLDWLKPDNTASFPWWLSFVVTIILPVAFTFNVVVEVIRIAVA